MHFEYLSAIMIGELSLRLSPEVAFNEKKLKKAIASILSVEDRDLNFMKVTRRSIDARKKNVVVNMTVIYSTGNDRYPFTEPLKRNYAKVAKDAPVVLIVGFGPAGLFAALRAIEKGIKPIVFERGSKIEERRKIIADISRKGVVDEDSNYCFGEGGAGTYSDGKLYTRSKKRGDNKGVLEILCQFGAPEDILTDSHPHIGSDKLPGIIKNIREEILKAGGEIHFDTKITDIVVEGNEAKGVITQKGDFYEGPVILATGHSAKDIYKLLDKKNIRLEAKGFAMGVRLEHPRYLIDKLQYHSSDQIQYLPAAEYNFTTQIDGRGVYSFCMCPGGVIVPSMSSPQESVVNGMSASARSGKWSNSAIVVQILPEDILQDTSEPLKLLEFQESQEKKFYEAAEKTLKAPAQRMTDFVNGKTSESLPSVSYAPGVISCRVDEILPSHISERLKKGFQEFDKKCNGFLSDEAVVIGLESRTSSPVRIPRDKETLEHIEIKNLYPAGEGSGYSGGIVSSAIDGTRCVDSYLTKIKQNGCNN